MSLADLLFQLGVGDFHELAWDGPSVLVGDGVFVNDPFLCGDVAYDDPGPFVDFRKTVFLVPLARTPRMVFLAFSI